MSQQECYECILCPLRGSRKEIRQHVFLHFTSEILSDYPLLRERPYHCPKCNDKKEWRDRTSLVRHFALTHDVLYDYCDRKDAHGRPYSKNKKVKHDTKKKSMGENGCSRSVPKKNCCSSDSISKKLCKSGSSKTLPVLRDFPTRCTTNVKVRLDVNAVSHYFLTQAQMSTDVINFQSNKPSLKDNPSSSISSSPKDLNSATNPSKAIKTNLTIQQNGAPTLKIHKDDSPFTKDQTSISSSKNRYSEPLLHINHSTKKLNAPNNMIHPEEKIIIENYSMNESQPNQVSNQTSGESNSMIQTDLLCLLCNVRIIPASPKTFNMHLKSCHFNNELMSEFMTKRPPYVCKHSLCSQKMSTKTKEKQLQFKSSIDLLDHLIDFHNLVLNMYNERVQAKIPSAINNQSTSAIGNNIRKYSNINSNCGNDKRKMLPLENENVFICMICRNKNGKINGCMKASGNENTMQTQRMIAPGVFTEEKSLRMHLIDVHLKDLILKYTQREIRTITNQTPLVCPFLQCRKKGLSFKEESLFHSHFLKEHHKQLNLPQLNTSVSPNELTSLFHSNVQRICLDCDYVENITRSAGIHMCKEHPDRLDKILKIVSMKNTLLPVKKSSLGIPWDKYITNFDILSKPKNKRKSEDTQSSVLKCKQMKTENEELCKPHSRINGVDSYENGYLTKTSNTSTEMSNLQSIDKKSSETLRPPTKLEMDIFLKDCYSKPFCRCCGLEVWDVGDSRGLRLNRLCKHLFREHFFQEVRASVIDLICQMKTSQRCPQCQEEFEEKELMEHMAVFHRRVLKSYWEYVTFSKTAYSLMKSGARPAKLQLDTKLNKLGEETGQTLKMQRIALQRTLGELAVGDVITQPDACFNVSSTLTYCHECWKIHNGIAPQVKGTVCQFAGFRKIRKIRKTYQEISEFESAGFLDPFKDPTEADCSLWETSDEHLHPDITVDIAKFILKEAGDEFCNMIYDEESAIQEFIQERSKLGKNPSILWKRLQPQVREMCDVCSTSLFNVHWTCTTCGCLICIDCYRTRKKGYPLIYSSAGKTTSTTISVPHKSRRKLIRNDIDDHFWPFCKNNIRHNPSRLLLTQIICGDISKNICRMVHEIKRHLLIPLKCNCCKPKLEKPTDNKSNDEFNRIDNGRSCQVKNNDIRAILKVARHRFNVFTLSECLVCSKKFKDMRQTIDHTRNNYKEFTEKQKTEKVLHMIEHFEQELRAHIKRNKDGTAFKCLLCDKFESQDITNAMLHISISHDKIQKLIGAFLKKRISAKNIVLNIDSKTRCRVCGMHYKHHMMTKKCIRIHAMTHYRKLISKEMLMNQSNDIHNQDTNVSFECYICGVRDTTSSYIINHLGIYHKRLDFYDTFVKEQSIIDDIKESSLLQNNNAIINHLDVSNQTSSEKRLQVKCLICDELYPKNAILRHQVDHFLPELIDYTKMQIKSNYGKRSSWCHHCGQVASCHTLLALATHYAVEHEMLNHFLALPELVNRKRNELFRQSSLSSPKVVSKFTCKLCHETLEIEAHDKAIDHFSLHIWCDYTETLHRKSLPDKINIKERNAPVKMEGKYGLLAWLNHHKFILGDNFSKVSKELKLKFSQRITNIISGTWCCLCQSKFSASNFLQHYTDHLEPLALREISTWGLTCRICYGSSIDFLTFQNLKHHYIEKHFKSKVINVIADISDVSFILELRKEMNISSVPDLNNQTAVDEMTKNDEHKIDPSDHKHEDAAISVKSCSVESMSFLQQITTVYGPELTKQTSEYSYSTSDLSEQRYDSSVNRASHENYSALPIGNIPFKDSCNLNDKEKNQFDSVSIHDISKQENQNTNAPHKWLCDGRLLLLLDPLHTKNIDLFKSQWRLGQPVLIANSSSHLNEKLWHPKAFLRDFGHLRHDLVNCLTGQTVPKAPLHEFWRGFSSIKDRLKDADDIPMLLKLKDWPPTSDLADYMPKRFQDLFSAFPMKSYTMREGKLNLAGYLPEYCLKPELGPKMYIAYGSALYSGKASTNLHIDMSDAVNCLVYVGFPEDGDKNETAIQVLKEIDKAGCDILMKRRVRSNKELPGALWHIFHPMHTSAIRNFLNQVALEKGKRLDPHDDPIHDQSTYLDAELRMRLYKEYGIQGYAIVQCAGDTVFIPAGACHQVRNLHNCIKVAEDFVSPENISRCLHLTQEFRQLTEWHTNHEDKLQIKSILYHSVKSAVTVLLKSERSSINNPSLE